MSNFTQMDKFNGMREMTEQVEDVNPFEGWVTVQEAARIVGRQNSVVRYWVQKGFIKAHLVGRRTKLVKLEQVRAYAETHLPHEADNELTP